MQERGEDSMYVCDILLGIAAGREEFIPFGAAYGQNRN